MEKIKSEINFSRRFDGVWNENINNDNLKIDEKSLNENKLYEQISLELGLNTKQANKSKLYAYGIVASVLVVFILAISYYHMSNINSNVDKNVLATCKTGKNEKKKVLLPDSSTVEMFANSELIFPEKFNDSIRKINFTGEGFFDIKKNVKPFVVLTNEIETKVLGTKFKITENKKTGNQEIILYTGKVEILNRVNNSRKILKPGDSLSFLVKNNSFIRLNKSFESGVLMSLEDKIDIEFSNTEIVDCYKKLSVKTGIIINYDNISTIKNFKINFNCKHTSVKDVLYKLNSFINKQYIVKGNSIVIE